MSNTCITDRNSSQIHTYVVLPIGEIKIFALH